jgi:hypothetical protein
MYLSRVSPRQLHIDKYNSMADGWPFYSNKLHRWDIELTDGVIVHGFLPDDTV